MINIVVPMAGAGSRFAVAGYSKPKPFIDLLGRPMIYRVLENLEYPGARFYLVAREDHLRAEPDVVNDINERFNVTWIKVSGLTEGTACTVLHARKFIDTGVPLVIANSDQIVDGGISGLIEDANTRLLDGSILCFEDGDRDPKWSFAKVDANGLVTQVKEKDPISDYATVGIYWFAKGSDFVDCALDMIVRNERVNGEFYTCPAYNFLISNDKKVGVKLVDPSYMHGIGTPDDLNAYLAQVSR